MGEKRNIQTEAEELQKLAPTLFSIKKEPPFKTPEEYFDTLSTRIQDATTSHSLEEIGNEHTFETPKGYFETLPSVIQERVAEANKSPWVRWFPNTQTYVYKFAIPITVALLVMYFGLDLFNKADIQNDLTVEEISIALQEDMITLEESFLVETLIKGTSASEEVINEDDKEIIDYLIENDVDVSIIINEIEQ